MWRAVPRFVVAVGAAWILTSPHPPSLALAVEPNPMERLPATHSGDGPAEIGQPRPALEVDAVDGSLINDRRVGDRPLVVDFFATWCQPCHRALADLVAARAAAGVGQIQILLVDFGESESVVRTWAASANLNVEITVAVDPSSVAAHRWGARRLPTTFVVDARGIVRHINRGWGPGYRDRLYRWLRDVSEPVGRHGP